MSVTNCPGRFLPVGIPNFGFPVLAFRWNATKHDALLRRSAGQRGVSGFRDSRLSRLCRNVGLIPYRDVANSKSRT